MATIKDYLAVRPCDLRPGDVLVATVTCHIVHGRDGGLAYRLYRCPQDAQLGSDGVPQGGGLGPPFETLPHVVEHIFPVVLWADAKPDLL